MTRPLPASAPRRLRPAGRRRGPARPIRAAIVLVFGAAFAAACDPEAGQSRSRRMAVSSREYNKGYKDGSRDAELALFDLDGSGVWIWMMTREYQQGYRQGWGDGWRRKRLEKEKASYDADRKKPPTESRELAPPPEPTGDE